MINRKMPTYMVTWRRKDEKHPEIIYTPQMESTTKNKTEAIARVKRILRSYGKLKGCYAFSATPSPLWISACHEEDVVMARRKKELGANKKIR
jgi:hypothetical protein